MKTPLRGANGWWMSNAHITQKQSVLLDQTHLTVAPVQSLNPATLMSGDDLEVPLHDCEGLLDNS